jgi:hypothetical protein
VTVAAMNRREVVDERAVEVEEDGGKAGHGGAEIWFGGGTCHE